MMKIQKVPQQKGTLAAFMNLVERVCNRLPPPAILFCLLFVCLLYTSDAADEL